MIYSTLFLIYRSSTRKWYNEIMGFRLIRYDPYPLVIINGFSDDRGWWPLVVILCRIFDYVMFMMMYVLLLRGWTNP